MGRGSVKVPAASGSARLEFCSWLDPVPCLGVGVGDRQEAQATQALSRPQRGIGRARIGAASAWASNGALI